jgi:hypothetical protein
MSGDQQDSDLPIPETTVSALVGSSVLSPDDGHVRVAALQPTSLVDVPDAAMAVDSAYVLTILDDLRLSSALTRLLALTVAEPSSATVVGMSGYTLLDEFTTLRIPAITAHTALDQPNEIQTAAGIVAFSLLDERADPITVRSYIGRSLLDISATDVASITAASALSPGQLSVSSVLGYALYDEELDPVRVPTLISYSLVETVPSDPVSENEMTKVSMRGIVRVVGSARICSTIMPLVTVDQDISLHDPDVTL